MTKGPLADDTAALRGNELFRAANSSPPACQGGKAAGTFFSDEARGPAAYTHRASINPSLITG
jgi:hypothetical protein